MKDQDELKDNLTPETEQPLAENQDAPATENVENEADEDNEDEETKKKRKRGGRGGSNNSGQKNKEMEEEMTKLSAELSEMKDKYLRLYAEFDNYRKRTGKEKLDLIKTASQEVMSAILPTIDDFERAIKAADTEGSSETVPQGIRLIHEKMAQTLQQQGLKAMESTGTPFDPDMHQALTKIPSPSPELKGKVVDTIEKGYYLGDKIIRHAKVIVGE